MIAPSGVLAKLVEAVGAPRLIVFLCSSQRTWILPARLTRATSADCCCHMVLAPAALKILTTAEKLIHFADEISSVNSNTTDMEILAEFFEENQDKAVMLAFGPESASAYDESFKLERVLPALKIFRGNFDGNDIGVYLFGTDPRNARGVSYLGTSIPGNYARVNQWDFKFDNLRQFINLEFDDTVIPIYSVHATSKQLTLFYHYTQHHVFRRYLQKKNSAGKRKYFLHITSKMFLRKILKFLKT